MDRATQLLRELVALPSVNPAFLPANDPKAGESRVAAFLADAGSKAGLQVAYQKVFPGRSNLILRLRPTGRTRRRILLAPHMDTVGAKEDSAFRPRLSNGRLHGRGACDTKGCVAAMFTAIATVAQSAQRPKETEIIFAGLVDEEFNQEGSRALAASGRFKADFAIIGEPTQLQVAIAHKGCLWMKMTTRGRAAHGSKPHLGKNAVTAMAGVVQCLESEYADLLAGRQHPLLGRPTINVGLIQGGKQPNIVPSYCEILIDRRTIPGETRASVEREIHSLLRKRGLSASFAPYKDAPCLAMETDEALPEVRQLLAAARRKKAVGVDFFCDASVISCGGTPSVLFGPGNIAQAHTDDEWISLASLERATTILTRFLLSQS
jgi:acetylornithine deacetylase/succinyl-diaminopimelate desuccinylase-like protein